MSKIALSPNASGTALFTIASPATNTDRTLTLPDSAGTVDTLQRAGNVLQVVQNDQTIARFSTTLTSFQDTGFFVNITPTSSSSKILISAAATILGSGTYVHMTIYRDSTDLSDWTNEGFLIGGNTWWSENSLKYLDSPTTTSQITYKIYARCNASGVVYVGRNASTGTNCQVIMQAMEIAG